MNVNRLQQLLIETSYDQKETEFLVNGLKCGFSIGYKGNPKVKLKSPNLKFRGVGSKLELWNKVMKEVKLGRYAGPFKEIPFKDGGFIQSPIGLVPKNGGKDTRLIFHLSYPRGKGLSVNENTPKEDCSVQYPDFANAIRLCMKVGAGAKIAKSDMKSAFRKLGIKPEHFRYLIMKAESPIDGKVYYFVDKCLPFGASISCLHFQRFSNAIRHIVKSRTVQDLVNYLDDYFFVALLALACNNQVKTFLAVCHEVNFPVSLEKTFWASTKLTFLGMLIDTIRQVVMIPTEKIRKALDSISLILGKGKTTIKQLQKLCGLLNFICRCVIPGRAFTRRLYAKTSHLLPHHHIRVSCEMKLDL